MYILSGGETCWEFSRSQPATGRARASYPGRSAPCRHRTELHPQLAPDRVSFLGRLLACLRVKRLVFFFFLISPAIFPKVRALRHVQYRIRETLPSTTTPPPPRPHGAEEPNCFSCTLSS